MRTRFRRWLVLGLAGGLAACAGTVSPSPEERLANAETEMKACKERFGLGAVPTPTNPVLYDPAKSPTFTPEGVDQVRVKTLCGKELKELLDARRAAADPSP